MTWVSKMGCFWATVILMCFTMAVLADTLYDCQEDCQGEPDDPVCGRWNFTGDDRARTKVSVYQWLRNECERKCFSKGDYKRVADMDICTKNGQTRMTYIFSEYWDPEKHEKCMRNESMKN